MVALQETAGRKPPTGTAVSTYIVWRDPWFGWIREEANKCVSLADECVGRRSLVFRLSA